MKEQASAATAKPTPEAVEDSKAEQAQDDV